MTVHHDLGQFWANLHANWPSYAWLLAIFTAIALCGWLIGPYLQR